MAGRIPAHSHLTTAGSNIRLRIAQERGKGAPPRSYHIAAPRGGGRAHPAPRARARCLEEAPAAGDDTEEAEEIHLLLLENRNPGVRVEAEETQELLRHKSGRRRHCLWVRAALIGIETEAHKAISQLGG